MPAAPRCTSSQVRFYNNDTVALSLVGENGPRISSKDTMKYGLYTARAQVDQNKGCVTAFYVSGAMAWHAPMRRAAPQHPPCCQRALCTVVVVLLHQWSQMHRRARGRL